MYEGFNVATVTVAWLCILCFALFIGLKLRWFRARMTFNTNVQSTDYGSMTGTYRPTGNERYAGGARTTSDATERLNHHRSMPNLSNNSQGNRNTETFGGKAATNPESQSTNTLAATQTNEMFPTVKKTATQTGPNNSSTPPKPEIRSAPEQPVREHSEGITKTTMLQAKWDVNSKKRNTSPSEKKDQHGTDRRKNPIAEASTGREDYLMAAKKVASLNMLSDSDSDGSEMKYQTVSDLSRMPLSFSENETNESVPSRGEKKRKAPVPPRSSSKFHEFDEFET